MRCNSTIQINAMMLKRLCEAQIAALECTAEALHTEVVQAQVMPFDVPTEEEEEKGKTGGGTLQNESTFVDTTSSSIGRVQIVSATPYARRLYYHPEYNFDKEENPFAGGEWFIPWLPGGIYQDFAEIAFKKFYRRFSNI